MFLVPSWFKTANVHAKVETEDAAGNPASAEADRDYGIDTDLPEAEITINVIADDDVINKAESEVRRDHHRYRG